MDKESVMSYFERMRSNSVIAATQYQRADTSTLLLLESVAYSLANIADSLKNIESSLESISDKATAKASPEAGRRQPPNNKRSYNDKKNIVDKCFESVAYDGKARFRDMCDSPLCEVTDMTLRRYIRALKDYQFENGFVRRLT